MAKHYGLTWMVTTDHGGRWHSKLYLDEAYPNLQVAREVVPEVIHYYGLELNVPAGDHGSVIFPHTHDEAQRLYEFESTYDRRNAGTSDPDSNTEARMLEALQMLDSLPEKPVVFANHPSRTQRTAHPTAATRRKCSATGTTRLPRWRSGWWDPRATRRYQSSGTAPCAKAVRADNTAAFRTRGGFDPMTSILGGLWDSMLGEGRRWWITANSDSHRHWSDGGVTSGRANIQDLCVLAENSTDILEALRSGRIFVATAAWCRNSYVNAATTDGNVADIGGSLRFEPGESIV